MVVFTRALVLYIIVVISMRIMGKRQIGQLQPYELAIAIMISELAAVPMQNTGIPLINGIIPILTLLVAQLTMSLLSLKSVRARAIICGKPTILVEKGRIKEEELRKEMYTINDLLEQLRIKDYPNIADVEYAILETNGQLSVIPKSQKRPVNPQDMNIKTDYEGIIIDAIIDGSIMENNLKIAGKDAKWLIKEIRKQHLNDPKEILYAGIDPSGRLFCQPQEKGDDKK